MKQGVLTQGRVRLLLSKGHSCYRQRRTGERKRKSVRGCIVDGNLSVISVVIVKKGENEIPGLTDNTIPRRLGPKRASKIRKLFNLSKEDNVCQYVIKRPLPVKDLSADVPKRTDKPQPSMPRSWLKGRRKLRKPRSSVERDPPLTEKAELPRAPSASDQIRET